MLSITSTRMDLDPSSKFDRTRPLALEKFITQHQWKALGEGVDSVYRAQARTATLCEIAIPAGMLIGILLVWTGAFMLAAFGDFVTFVIGLVFIGSVRIPTSVLASVNRRRAEKLREIAENTSKQLHSVTIHYKEEETTANGRHRHSNQAYFELFHPLWSSPVIIESAEATVFDNAGPPPPTPFPPVTVFPTALTAAACAIPQETATTTTRERLAALDKLRDVLGETEYEQARGRIIDSLFTSDAPKCHMATNSNNLCPNGQSSMNPASLV